MPTFPVDLESWLQPFRVSGQTFDLGEGLTQQGQTAGGEILRSGGAARLWRGKLTLARIRGADVPALEARLHALRGKGASFLIRDYRKAASVKSATVRAYNGTTLDILTLQGLAAATVVAVGDYIAFDYSGRRALHQVVSGATANSSGVTGNIEVVPPFRAGIANGLAVSVGNPSLRAVMVPGSLDMGQSSGIWHEGISFGWTQTLSEVP